LSKRTSSGKLNPEHALLSVIKGTASVNYADKRALPLARRAFNTLRPPTVALRARKPWVRARLIRLG
jgi:hypothetical protein